MCTVAIYTEVWSRFPLVIAGNRDEFAGRGWREPGYHWPASAGVFGPQDSVSGGSWLGLNASGLMCAILNQGRQPSPGTGMRSRGELVVNALACGPLEAACAYLAALDAGRYLGFHMVLASARRVVVASSTQRGVELQPLSRGVHIVSSRGVDADDCPKSRRFLDHLRAHAPREPEDDGWGFFRGLLRTRASAGRKDGFWIELGNGYGTRSSAIAAAEAAPDAGAPAWRLLHSRRVAAPGPSCVRYVEHRLLSHEQVPWAPQPWSTTQSGEHVYPA